MIEIQRVPGECLKQKEQNLHLPLSLSPLPLRLLPISENSPLIDLYLTHPSVKAATSQRTSSNIDPELIKSRQETERQRARDLHFIGKLLQSSLHFAHSVTANISACVHHYRIAHFRHGARATRTRSGCTRVRALVVAGGGICMILT